MGKLPGFSGEPLAISRNPEAYRSGSPAVERPLCLFLAIALIVTTATAINAADRPAPEGPSPAARKSIETGLRWLSRRQNEDGSFGSGSYRGNAAISGLCGMAFMAAGSTPNRGPYGAQVDKVTEYLLAVAQQNGFICERVPDTNGPMYSHGFATLFLAECYGMSQRQDLHEKLSAAVNLIVQTQNSEGGWRYRAQKEEFADISVTVCQVMALRAARNAGLYVPNATIDHATDYVKRCQNADGGFAYMLRTRGESAFPRSAAAIVALYSAGIYKGDEITRGLDYIAQFRPDLAAARRVEYLEYGHYYAAQAMWQAGGARWSHWYPAVSTDIVGRQSVDGFWTSAFGPDYATAMYVLVLEMPVNQLPIFQR
jgi:squalene-hopene cyclase-like protein/prenyltransferase/squalene oxidase-like repeat protein